MSIESSVHCAHLLTVDGWVRDAILHLSDQGIITRIDRGGPELAGTSLSGHVIPGMPNLHSHAFQRLMTGLSYAFSHQSDSFWTWREAMYRLAGKVTPGQLQAIAAWLQLEMLRAGYTSCAEFHYLHHQPGGAPYGEIGEMSARILAAADSSGIALTLLPVLYCQSGFNSAGVNGQQSRFYNSPDRYLELYDACSKLVSKRPQQQLGLAPHSLRAVSGAQLDQVMQHVGKTAAGFHIHISEQQIEVDECLHHLGSRPLAWLLDNQNINQRWCLVHATHLDESEIHRAAESGAIAGLCPTTEADLGDGFFEIEAWLDAGGRFGIGSDSNLRVSVDEELRWLENGARLRSHRRNVLARDGLSCGRFLYEKAVTGGAVAMGQTIGKVQAGIRADLVELDDQHPLLEGKKEDAVLDTWLFGGDPAMIRSVHVAGEKLLDRGHHAKQEGLERAFRVAIRELIDP